MIQTPPRTIMEVFESLPEGTLAEVINNQLIMTPSPDFWHQDIVTEVASQPRLYVNQKEMGKILVAPMDVYFGWKNVFQPDIIFLSTAQTDLIQEGKIKGAPDLIIEVLSPRTEKFDRKEKKKVYEEHGVKEYWMIDVKTKVVTGFQLKENKYTEIPSEKGTITSILLGTTIQF